MKIYVGLIQPRFSFSFPALHLRLQSVQQVKWAATFRSKHQNPRRGHRRIGAL